MKIKLAIIGSRTFNNYELLKEKMHKLITQENYEITHIVSGGANGADKLGEKYAKEFNIPTIIFPAEWNKYGKSAGFIRNKDIIKNADVVVAFWDGQSRGTKNSIDLANSSNKPVFIVKWGSTQED